MSFNSVKTFSGIRINLILCIPNYKAKEHVLWFKIISCSCSVYFAAPENTAFIQLDTDFFFVSTNFCVVLCLWHSITSTFTQITLTCRRIVNPEMNLNTSQCKYVAFSVCNCNPAGGLWQASWFSSVLEWLKRRMDPSPGHIQVRISYSSQDINVFKTLFSLVLSQSNTVFIVFWSSGFKSFEQLFIPVWIMFNM